MVSKYRRRPTEQELEQIKSLYLSSGYTADMIADELGRDRSTIYRQLHKLGITRTYSQARGLGFKHGRATAPVFKRGYGAESPHWKGGFHQHYGRNGKYYLVRYIFPDDPYICMAFKSKYILEHRYVMAQQLGRPLTKNEVVHHINGITHDNRKANLQLLTRSSHSAHILLQEAQTRIRDLEAQLAQQRLEL